MINKNKCMPVDHSSLRKFAMFKHLIHVGDHICMTCPVSVFAEPFIAKAWLTKYV